MDELSLRDCEDESLLDGVGGEKFFEVLELTDDSLVKKRKNRPRSHGDSGSEINSARVKGELAGYAYPLTGERKRRIVEKHAGVWEPYFNHEVYCVGVNALDRGVSLPVHPWQRLKQVREKEGGVEDLSLAERYALRFVKTFYAEKWRGLGR